MLSLSNSLLCQATEASGKAQVGERINGLTLLVLAALGLIALVMIFSYWRSRKK